MGSRVKARLEELGWQQHHLLARIPDLDSGTLSALIQRDNLTSQWSDEIAEALGVEHRWLQRGVEPKLRQPKDWPFRKVTPEQWRALSEADRAECEGYVRRVVTEAAPPMKSDAA